MGRFLSAYRQGYSADTALLCVQNDILKEVNKDNVILLVLLVLSAAIGNIDHERLVNRLSILYGIGGIALK